MNPLDELAEAAQQAGSPVSASLRAGATDHVLAACADLVILAIPVGVAAYGVGAVSAIIFGFDADRVTLIVYSVMVLVYSLTDVFMAGTPGKRMLDLRIGSFRQTRAPLWMLIIRWAVRRSGELAGFGLTMALVLGRRSAVPAATVDALATVTTLLLVAVALGSLLCLTPDRRCLHDLVAGTALFRDMDLRPAGSTEGHAFEVRMERWATPGRSGD